MDATKHELETLITEYFRAERTYRSLQQGPSDAYFQANDRYAAVRSVMLALVFGEDDSKVQELRQRRGLSNIQWRNAETNLNNTNNQEEKNDSSNRTTSGVATQGNKRRRLAIRRRIGESRNRL